MTLNAIAKLSTPGAVGFDIDTPITVSLAEAAIEAGMSFVVRYGSLANSPRPGDLTAAEAEIILKSGLALMMVQHVLYAGWSPTQALGQEHGQEIVANAQIIGLPKGTNIWLDLEGIASKTSAANVIDYCNVWDQVVAGAGFITGLYVGANVILSGEQLYENLELSYYWKSGSKVPEIPTRGFCMVQTIAPQYKLHGIAYDRNVIQEDGTGQTPWWAISASGGVQAQSEEASMAKVPVSTPAVVVAAMPVPAPVAPAPPPPTAAPTVTQAVTIDFGSFASMFLQMVAPAAANALGIGVDALINTVPMGSILTSFLGPQVISQYVSQGLTVAEGAVAKGNITIANPNFIETTAASLFNAGEQHLAAFLGDLVGPTISSLVAKVAPAAPAPAAPAAGTVGSGR
jgi:hypothetical protein